MVPLWEVVWEVERIQSKPNAVCGAGGRHWLM